MYLFVSSIQSLLDLLTLNFGRLGIFTLKGDVEPGRGSKSQDVFERSPYPISAQFMLVDVNQYGGGLDSEHSIALEKNDEVYESLFT